MPLSTQRKTWYFDRLKDLLDNHSKIFLVEVRGIYFLFYKMDIFLRKRAEAG